MIYRLMTQAEYDAAKNTPEFKGVGIDIDDGFIHFSTWEQLSSTYETFFKNAVSVVLLSFEADQFGDKLRWEKSPRSGKIYPHLYGTLSVATAKSVTPVTSTTFASSKIAGAR